MAPRSAEPLKCLPLKSLPSDSGWIYEIKFDGYRSLALIDKGTVQFLSRKTSRSSKSLPWSKPCWWACTRREGCTFPRESAPVLMRSCSIAACAHAKLKTDKCPFMICAKVAAINGAVGYLRRTCNVAPGLRYWSGKSISRNGPVTAVCATRLFKDCGLAKSCRSVRD